MRPLTALTAAAVLATCQKLGYPVPESGEVLLFGVRAEPGAVDAFDDVLGAVYRLGGQVRMERWAGTTDPGLASMLNPVNPRGCAILKEGFYKDLWRPGLHKGMHPALVQTGACTVYRDRDRDREHDYAGTLDTGHFGINAHDAYSVGLATKVGGWSAGCQVWQRTSEHRKMLGLVNGRATPTAPVSYALFRQSQLV